MNIAVRHSIRLYIIVFLMLLLLLLIAMESSVVTIVAALSTTITTSSSHSRSTNIPIRLLQPQPQQQRLPFVYQRMSDIHRGNRRRRTLLMRADDANDDTTTVTNENQPLSSPQQQSSDSTAKQISIPTTTSTSTSKPTSSPTTATSIPTSSNQNHDTNNDDDNNHSHSSIPQQYIGNMENGIQQLTFIMAFVALGWGTQFCIHFWYTSGMALLGTPYFYNIQTHIFPMVFGSIFAIVGICHFIYVENFARIVPPYNCWGGLWKIPAPFHNQMNISYEAYHSYWTGMVEFLGGVWLLYTGIMSSSSSSSSSSIVPATILFGLTIGVTPANLYMFTHNASPGGIIPPLQYPFGHVSRFIIQCGLLSNFYIMMHPIQL